MSPLGGDIAQPNDQTNASAMISYREAGPSFSGKKIPLRDQPLQTFYWQQLEKDL
jgi:hypothetical protein